MAAKGLRLYALTNHLIATHAEQEDGDPAAAAAALFAVTAKSLGGSGVQANARDQVLRHHYSAMDRLREVSDRLKAGEALPDDPPPSRVIQQATRLKELSRELRQFSSQGLSRIASPRTARQLCRIFRLGDAAFAEWEAQQRGRGRERKASGGKPGSKASGSKGRRTCTPSPKKSGKRKTPEKQPRSASRLAPDDSPVVAAAAAAQGEPQLQRRRSSDEEEGSSLVPKQLFVGGWEGGAASPPAAAASQGVPKQACQEWAAFKAFMASPRRPGASGAAGAPPAAQGPAGEQPQQAQQPAQQGQQQPMDVDSRQQSSPAAAATPATAEQPRPGTFKVAAGGTPASPASASRAAAVPLSPKQGMLARPPPDHTSEKLLPAPGLCGSPLDKENGCGLGGWHSLWDSSAHEPEAWPAPTAGAAPSSRSRPPAAVRRGLLLLQSPATERAAAAREQMAAEAAEVLAADVLRLLSESDISGDSQAPCSTASSSWRSSVERADMAAVDGGSSAAEDSSGSGSGLGSSAGTSSGGADGDAASSQGGSSRSSLSISPVSSASSSSSPSGSPEEAALQASTRRQPHIMLSPAEAAPVRRTLVICASNRLFEFDAAAAKAAAAAPEVHAGGGLEEWQTRRNLNTAGRAHSIMRPIALPAAVLTPASSCFDCPV